MTKIIVVYSGGLDSFTLLNEAVDMGHDVSTISFDYGQKHKRELDSVRKFCLQESIDHKVVDISSIKEIFSKSSRLIVFIFSNKFEDDKYLHINFGVFSFG